MRLRRHQKVTTTDSIGPCACRRGSAAIRRSSGRSRSSWDRIAPITTQWAISYSQSSGGVNGQPEIRGVVSRRISRMAHQSSAVISRSLLPQELLDPLAFVGFGDEEVAL